MAKHWAPDPSRCKEHVYVKVTYRLTGQGTSGIEMYRFERQCSRSPTHDGYCWQHRKAPKE